MQHFSKLYYNLFLSFISAMLIKNDSKFPHETCVVSAVVIVEGICLKDLKHCVQVFLV